MVSSSFVKVVELFLLYSLQSTAGAYGFHGVNGINGASLATGVIVKAAMAPLSAAVSECVTIG
ncbi:MAG: hypothetical protein HP491_13415 [Nitrospira sp.]|nr:hypothetical protein [Nitrospira sp.]MBH0181154.1 hypothetical protein [Nitrospira sp.]